MPKVCIGIIYFLKESAVNARLSPIKTEYSSKNKMISVVWFFILQKIYFVVLYIFLFLSFKGREFKFFCMLIKMVAAVLSSKISLTIAFYAPKWGVSALFWRFLVVFTLVGTIFICFYCEWCLLIVKNIISEFLLNLVWCIALLFCFTVVYLTFTLLFLYFD